MARHNDTGNWGEDSAREYLITKGYTILDTNVRFGKNELDIVARHNDRIVFVEVKTRSTDEYDPLDAVDRKKNLTPVPCCRIIRQHPQHTSPCTVRHNNCHWKSRETPPLSNIFLTLFYHR